MLLVRCLDQPLQVLDQVWQVLHLNITLDDVARIEVTNCLDVLLECLFGTLLLSIQLVGVLLRDLCADFTWKVCPLCNHLRFLEHGLLEEVLYFDVVVFLNELDDECLVLLVLHQQEDHVVLDFHLDDLLVRGVKYGQLVFEVADLDLIHL